MSLLPVPANPFQGAWAVPSRNGLGVLMTDYPQSFSCLVQKELPDDQFLEFVAG